jgi:hypothetical protein
MASLGLRVWAIICRISRNVSSEAKLQGVTDIGWDRELGEGSVEEYVLQPGADLLDGFVRHTSVCKLGLSG